MTKNSNIHSQNRLWYIHYNNQDKPMYIRPLYTRKCIAPECKNTTCIHPYCPLHLKEYGLEIRKSETGGFGLFATRALKAGTRVGWYTGEILTNNELTARYMGTNAAYTLEVSDDTGAIPKKIHIDAAVVRCYASMVNHASGNQANCELTQTKTMKLLPNESNEPIYAALETKRIVPKDTELLADYGSEYRFDNNHMTTNSLKNIRLGNNHITTDSLKKEASITKAKGKQVKSRAALANRSTSQKYLMSMLRGFST